MERHWGYGVDTVKESGIGKFAGIASRHLLNQFGASAILGAMYYIHIRALTVIVEISGGFLYRCGRSKPFVKEIEFMSMRSGTRQRVKTMQTQHLLSADKRAPAHLAQVRIDKAKQIFA